MLRHGPADALESLDQSWEYPTVDGLDFPTPPPTGLFTHDKGYE